MKIIVHYSGGKDSQASLIWAVLKYGLENVEAIFCDTGWESQLTYDHINQVTSLMGVKLTILKSKKFDGMVGLAVKKYRFPTSNARYCTTELKTAPGIDYILDNIKEHTIIIQGIRKNESSKRSKMDAECMYFKYYLEPYGYDKEGKPKFHTYRRKDVLEYVKKYNSDIIRPIFHWTAQQTIDFIKKNGQQPNPLYSLGFKRVGCFPCIMSVQRDALNISKLFPERIEEIERIEKQVGATFFPTDYIPKKFCTWTSYGGLKVPSIRDVERYVLGKNATGDLFMEPEDSGFSCMSYYGLCE